MQEPRSLEYVLVPASDGKNGGTLGHAQQLSVTSAGSLWSAGEGFGLQATASTGTLRRRLRPAGGRLPAALTLTA
jgi:hypothetical protein